MNDACDGEAFIALLAAMAEVRRALGNTRAALAPLPEDVAAYETLSIARSIAATALIKSVEQEAELIALTIRATLAYEQVELTGLLPRAIANLAEGARLSPNSDRWSDIVRLRNRLVHEYALPRAQQWARLVDAWHAADELIAISLGLVGYLQRLNIEDRP